MNPSVAARAQAPVDGRSPRHRLENLCDEGSFRPIRSAVLSGGLGNRARPGDGVVAGAGRVGGCPVFCYCQDPGFLGGSLGESHADSIVRTMELAGDAGAPVVGFIESGGARLQEGHSALAGYGRIFRASVRLSHKVPQVSVIDGVSAGGGAYSPALTDFVVMTDSARLFLTGPKVLERAVGETVSMEQLGGPAVHRANGVCQLSVNDEAAAIDRVRHLLDLLPHRFGARARVADAVAPQLADPGLTVPSDPRRVYDVRHTVAALADSGSALETCDRWGQGMYTGIARLAGRTVGIVANQTRRLGGVIDAEAAEKASVFVRDCDRFGLPLIVLVDTPGFMPGLKQEKCGVIRHGASLLKAFAGAEVPKLTVVLRKAFGGAAITMNSRDLGADVVFAWPGAEIGIMSASQAVGIVSRRELESVGDDDRKQIAERYAERHLTATAAAANGFVDEVIEPDQTRSSLVWALATIDGLP